MKTVYIIGAGFSIEAGAPSQENLIRLIFEIADDDPYVYSEEEIQRFKEFLSSTLNIPEELHTKVPLEDIFTPLDKCISENISFRNLNVRQVIEIRELIYYLIGKAIQERLRNPDNYRYVRAFAEKIVDQSLERINHQYSNKDPVSVISTNWDILLDNALMRSIGDTGELGVVDYCCHISSFYEGDSGVKPGLEILGRGGFVAKLIKLHGSLNWLQCPKCARVYVDFYNKIAMNQYRMKENCRHCERNFNERESNILVSNLVMPTYLKKLTNVQYKSIWRAAENEISEADKIVFIGYSLPFADFEMRQLLSRMTRKNAKIEVVDYGDPESENIKSLQEKYEVFFGRRDIKFFLHGAKDYIYNEMN